MQIPAPQQPAADFLQSLAGVPPTQTHISAIFVGETVYKIKKAVRLPFLDFTTLESRARFIRREFALNHRAAPKIYRGIGAIQRGRGGKLCLVAESEANDPLEWVLLMAPIAAGDMLATIAGTTGVTPALADAIGDAVAADHAARAPILNWDMPGALGKIAADAAEGTRAAGLPADQIATWESAFQAALARLAPTLRRRAAAGFVRHCHADLHLGNLCLQNGTPTLFDALEFSDSLATIDIAYDLAFLLMDLDLQAGRPTANRVFNRYLARTGDWDLPALAPTLMSLRSMLRAQIQSLSGEPASAALYLQGANACLHPPQPRIVAIGGLPGTGKSTLARHIAPSLGPAPGAAIAAAAAEVPFQGIWLTAPTEILETRLGARRNDASDADVAVLRETLRRHTGKIGWMMIDLRDAERLVLEGTER